MKKDHLSISQLNKWLMCPKQYEFHYEKGMRTATGFMMAGNAYHDTLAYIFFRKMRDPKFIPSIELISDQFAKEFTKTIENNKKWGVEVNWRDDKPGILQDQGIKLVNIYCRVKLPYVKPIAIEQRIEAKIAGIPFIMVADVVELGCVRDHKFTTNSYSETKVNNDLQATAYTIGWNRPFCWDLALNQTNPFVQTVWAPRTQEDFDFFNMLVTEVHRSIETGLFPPNPTGWVCSETYCGYYHQCRSKGTIKAPLPLSETLSVKTETDPNFWESILNEFVSPYDF